VEWLNYHHLFYFHAVVREGGVAAAARKLRLSHPTVSTQLRQLEEALGEPLFSREGRGLTLTETGRFVAGYAEEIFSLGKELLDGVRTRPTARAPRLAIGISDPVPKLVARRFLAVYDGEEPTVRLTLRQASTPELVAELLAHRIDAVLTDAAGPASPGVFDHFLGECGTTFFASPALARRLASPHRARASTSEQRKASSPRGSGERGSDAEGGLVKLLDDAPLLLPGTDSALRRGLEDFFAKRDVHPRVVAEIDDSALLKDFARDGIGVFAGPTPLASQIRTQYRVAVLGEAPSVRQRFHLLSTERRIAQPLVSKLLSGGHAIFPGRRTRMARTRDV
jgi:LysR family transcriptional activator of nhaA